MLEQTNTVHMRGSSVSRASLAVDVDEGKIQVDERRRIAEVEGRMLEGRPNDDAPIGGEVAGSHDGSRQQAKQDAEPEIPRLESQRLVSSRASCGADLALSGFLVQKRCEQARYVFRTVFPVGVEGDDEVVVFDESPHGANPEDDRTLVAEIEGRDDEINIVERRQLGDLVIPTGGIINDDKVNQEPVAGQSGFRDIDDTAPELEKRRDVEIHGCHEPQR